MAAILHALQGILTIVIMIATGFYLSRKGWFSESFSSAVAQLVTKVCLPTYMIVNLTVNFSHDQLIEMSGGLPYRSFPWHWAILSAMRQHGC